MKKFLIVLTATLSCLAATARTLPGEAFGKFKYTVHYKWGLIDSNVANATITFEEGKWNDQKAYYSHAVISANSIFRLFMNADYIVDTYFTQSDKPAPLYFLNPYKKDGKDGKYEYIYKKDKILSDHTLGDDSDKAELKQDGKTMDLLSMLHFVRFADISEGKTLNLHVLIAGKAYPAKLTWKCVDKERFEGRTAEHLHLQMTERGLMENGSGNELELWRDTGKGRLFLGMEVPLSAGAMSVSIEK